jgi:hypothetical protein
MQLTQEQYYTPPSQAVFDDFKQAAIKVWQTMDDSFGYVTGKVNKIKDLTNVQDNYAYMIAMFDIHNQQKVNRYLQLPESKDLLDKLL